MQYLYELFYHLKFSVVTFQLSSRKYWFTDKLCTFGRGEASNYLRKAGETHGIVEINISVGKCL